MLLPNLFPTRRNETTVPRRLIEFAVACLLLPLFSVEPVRAQCASTANLSCGVYETCSEKYCPCEQTEHGYFIRYGKKYCERFLASSGWTEAYDNWRDKTLLCLQERIVPKLDIIEFPVCDCKAMKEHAFKTHVECYTQPGSSICDLPVADYLTIYNIIDNEDILGDEYAKAQFKAVMDICKNDGSTDDQVLKLIDKIIDELTN